MINSEDNNKVFCKDDLPVFCSRETGEKYSRRQKRILTNRLVVSRRHREGAEERKQRAHSERCRSLTSHPRRQKHNDTCGRRCLLLRLLGGLLLGRLLLGGLLLRRLLGLGLLRLLRLLRRLLGGLLRLHVLWVEQNRLLPTRLRHVGLSKTRFLFTT